MAQEAQGACRAGVGSGLKDSDQISHFRLWQMHRSGQHIERRTERPGDVHGLCWLRVQPAQQSNWIVSLDSLPEVSRSGQVVMHAPIGDKELPASRDLDVIDSGDVDASFTHQETAWLHHRLSSLQERLAPELLH